MKIQAIVGALVSLVALVWLGMTYDLAALLANLAAMNPWYVAPAAGLLVLNFLARALRWRSLFGTSRPPTVHNAFATLTIGQLFNNILPARSGDLIRVYLLGRSESLSKSKVLGTLVVEKVSDLGILALLVGLVFLLRPLPDWFRQGVFGISIVAATAAAALVALPGLARRLFELIEPLLAKLPVRAAAAVHGVGTGFIDGLRGLSDRTTLARFIVISALIWLSEITLILLIARAFDMPLGPGESLYVLVFIAAALMIPSSPGFIGTYEVFGARALQTLGYSPELALAVIVALHAIMLLGGSALGAIGLVMYKRQSAAETVGDLIEKSLNEESDYETKLKRSAGDSKAHEPTDGLSSDRVDGL